jgi:hypothetical protein
MGQAGAEIVAQQHTSVGEAKKLAALFAEVMEANPPRQA